MTVDAVVLLLAAAVQSGTPILFATLGEIVTEKSGVLNLGVEGIMMIGALSAFLAAGTTGAPFIGVLAGGFCGGLMAATHGLVCLGFQGNQVVSGLAVTILGTNLANYIGTPFVGQGAPGFHPTAIPLLGDIPLIGAVFFRQDLLVYLSYLLPGLLWLMLERSRWGLGLRVAGENPEAGSAAGLPMATYRWIGILAGGFLMGIGGAYLSLAYTHIWTTGLSAGRGWIAVALVIFAFWRPERAPLGAYLFGGVMALQLRLQAMGATLPSSLLLMLPYGLTVVVLVLSCARQRGGQAPAFLGVNMEPSE